MNVNDQTVRLVKRLSQSESDLWHARLYAEGLLKQGPIREKESHNNHEVKVSNKVRDALESAIIASYASAFRILIDASGQLNEIPEYFTNWYSRSEKVIHDSMTEASGRVLSFTEIDIDSVKINVEQGKCFVSHAMPNNQNLVSSAGELEVIIGMIDKVRGAIKDRKERLVLLLKNGRY